MSHKEWIFIIDTEQYAGNFERNMCAFMTGMVGECGVGAGEAQLHYEQVGLVEKDFDWEGVRVQWSAEDFRNPFAGFIVNRSDEHGVGRPTSCCPTPGWFNHGMGGHFRDGQEEEALVDYKKVCLKEAKKKVHKNDQTRHAVHWKENAKAPLRKYDANLSVAIFFNKKPTDEMCNLMIKRAKRYVTEYRPGCKYESDRQIVTITSFRLLSEETKQTEEFSWSSMGRRTFNRNRDC